MPTMPHDLVAEFRDELLKNRGQGDENPFLYGIYFSLSSIELFKTAQALN